MRKPCTQAKEICIYDSPAALSRAAAALFRKLAMDKAENGGAFNAVLSGGSTPSMLYGVLASDEFRDTVPWGAVHLFWGDERCVGPKDPESNYGTAYREFISRTDIPPENIHRIKGEIDPRDAALEYEGEIRRRFGLQAPSDAPAFDLVFLGLGPDGHTLSIFPKTAALEENKRLVTANYAEGPGAWRVTMTLRLVNNASMAVFLVSGKGKADITREILEGCGRATPYPAELVCPIRGRLVWMMDRDAAGRLCRI